MALPSHFLCDSPKIAEIGFAITHSCSAHLRDEMRGDVGTQSVKELVLSYLLSSLGPHFPQLRQTLLAPPGRLILRAEKVGGKQQKHGFAFCLLLTWNSKPWSPTVPENTSCSEHSHKAPLAVSPLANHFFLLKWGQSQCYLVVLAQHRDYTFHMLRMVPTTRSKASVLVDSLPSSLSMAF